MLKSETDEITFKNRNNYKTDDVKRGFEDGHIDSKILIFRDIIPMDNFIEHSTMLIKKLFPQWRHLKTKEFTDGITNQLILIENIESKERVLVRGFGNQTDLLIDRNQELKSYKNMIMLSKFGFCKTIYARFANGLVYGYQEGIPLDENNKKIAILIAKRLASLHKIQDSSHKEACLFKMINKWFAQMRTLNKLTLDELSSLEKLIEEANWLQQHLKTIESPIVFCHNDLLSANIILQENRNKLSIAVEFIDFEYAGNNYRGFDISNHFCEYAGFDCDYSLFPDDSFQKEWLKAYLDEYNGRESSDEEIFEIHKEVTNFTMASHFFWGIWARFQAEISSIEFDYRNYGLKRLTEYFKLKSNIETCNNK
ncbi:Choline/ethanolamine kinase domain-containing protein [Rozella allomycis CSF55]|uniref:ethanolamine kinase n=1 Tax=Rozella allomycis (strain CSF55) TaxID=988480 RepID=A0A075AU98_ROZAC|nr:Choline/ethanolamine kinase domain-containing protein [Rozella allomycis CSF55]|eukprot:EPZ33730.1 Choline/ethanolamine kinase domain-containing protein [Rozella allomycis CSF55]